MLHAHQVRGDSSMRTAFDDDIHAAKSGQFVLILCDTHRRQQDICRAIGEKLRMRISGNNFTVERGSIRVVVPDEHNLRGLRPDRIRRELWVTDVSQEVWITIREMELRIQRKT